MQNLTYGEVQKALTLTPDEQKVFLVHLDTLKMQEIGDEEEQTQYQLENWDILRGGHLKQWLEKFTPHLLEPSAPIKRTRMSPNRVKYCPRPVCKECQGETIDDVFQGRVVCKMCGLIQSSSMLISDADINVFGIQHPLQTYSTSVIHEYSRIVYFVSVLNVLQGATQPTIPSCDYQKLQEKCMELCAKNRDRVTDVIVRAAIHLLRLPKRHLRHSYTLAGKIGSSNAGLLEIDGEDVSLLMKTFRIVEVEWDQKKELIFRRFKRKSFFNYRFLLGVLSERLNINTSLFRLTLKTKKLQEAQLQMFDYVTKSIDFNGIQKSFRMSSEAEKSRINQSGQLGMTSKTIN